MVWCKTLVLWKDKVTHCLYGIKVKSYDAQLGNITATHVSTDDLIANVCTVSSAIAVCLVLNCIMLFNCMINNATSEKQMYKC